MNDNHIDYLLTRARLHWIDNSELPVDLYMDLTNAGVHVEREERKYRNGN